MDGFDAAIEAIYSAAFGGGGWESAIDRMCTAVGANGLIVNPVRLDRPGMLLISDNLLPSIGDYERYWRHRDRRIRAGLSHEGVASGIVVCERTIGITAEDRAGDPFYQEFLRPLDIEFFAAYLFNTADGQMYSVSAQRATGRGEFDDGELTRIAGLGRHLVRALDLAPRVASAAAHVGSLVAGFDQLGHGLMTIDRQGRIEPLNTAAERLVSLCADRDRRAGHGRLRPAGDPEFERFVAAVRARLAGGPVVEPVVLGRRRGLRMLLQMLPAAPVQAGGVATAERSAAVISIYDLDAVRTGSVVELLCRSGLTAGEARVAAEIGSGRTPRDAAEALGLSEATVRSVLKTIFGKFDLHKQSELAVLVSGLRGARLDGG